MEESSRLGQTLFISHRSLDLNTVRLFQVRTHCFSRQAHGATLVRIFLGFWNPKSDKQLKVLKDCLEYLPTVGLFGNQTSPRYCASWESLITLGTSLEQISPDNPFGLSPVCTRVVGVSRRTGHSYGRVWKDWTQPRRCLEGKDTASKQSLPCSCINSRAVAATLVQWQLLLCSGSLSYLVAVTLVQSRAPTAFLSISI